MQLPIPGFLGPVHLCGIRHGRGGAVSQAWFSMLSNPCGGQSWKRGAQVFQSANPGRDQPCGAQTGKEAGAATLAWLPMACLAHGGQSWTRGMQLLWPHTPGPNKTWKSQLWKRRHRPAMEEGDAASLVCFPRVCPSHGGQPWKKVAPVPWPGSPGLEWSAEETSGREGTAALD